MDIFHECLVVDHAREYSFSSEQGWREEEQQLIGVNYLFREGINDSYSVGQ